MRLIVATLAVSSVVVCGCNGGGEALVQVTGSVTVGGKPAEGASILFHPEDPGAVTASGVVNADGTFNLVSSMKEGVAAGRYKVTITWPDPTQQPTKEQIMMGTAEPGPDLLKGKYATRDKTTLIAEVTSSTSTLPPFEL